MRRRSFLAGSASLAALLAAGCASDSQIGNTVLTQRTQLDVLNWSDYVDPDLLAILPYELTYSELWEDNFTGQDLFGPGWDVVVPTNWLAAQYVQQRQVQRLPVELIPNHVNIDPVFLSNNWDRGARFHMPWQAGITGIAYNPELTGRELNSVNDLFADDLRGRVAMIGEMREAIGLAMLANGDDPGRPTPSTAEAGFALLQAAGEAGQFASWGFAEFTDQLSNGEVAASMAWSGDVVTLQAERPDIEFIVPDDGAISWFDTMVIPVGAANVVGAAEFMNTFYEPAIAATNTEFVQFITPVLGVREELESRGGASAQLANNPILFPDDATRSRLFQWGGFDDLDAENDLDERFAVWAGVA